MKTKLTPDWSKIKNTRRGMRKYWLNDYFPLEPRLRVEEHKGGNRTLWRAKTTLKKMKETQRFLENSWNE